MTGGADWSTSCPGCGARHEGWMAECPKCGRRETTGPPRRVATPPTAPSSGAMQASDPRPRAGARGAPRLYCPFCGKHAAPGATRCDCGPEPAAAPGGGTCPRCAGSLEPTVRGEATIDVCGRCHGVWFDRSEVEKVVPLVTSGEKPPRVALPRRENREAIAYLPCVRCGERMARRLFAPGAAVIVDICRVHGLWFDGGELEHVAAFVGAGGLAAARARDDRAPRRPLRTGEKSSSGGGAAFDAADLVLGLFDVFS